MQLKLPSPILFVLERLNRAGHEAYVVGGCVRDSILGSSPSDWDVTTSALPHQTMEIFKDFRTLDNGIRHGTVTVFIEELPIEITTYRIDGDYLDHRRPDTVTFSPSLTEDLQRRDFTINAMAYHPDLGLVDPFDGQKDLQLCCIRCVGDPQKRFNEDALRILRAIRFSSVLGFEIHTETQRAIHQLCNTLTNMAIERVQVEFVKWLCGQPDRLIADYKDVLTVLLPMIDWGSLNIPPLNSSDNAVDIRFTLFLYPLSPELGRQVLHHLRMPKQTTERIVAMLNCKTWSIQEDRALLLLLNQIGPQLTDTLLCVRGVLEDTKAAVESVKRIIKQNKCYSLNQLAVNGEDLLKEGVLAGPALGETLQRLLLLVIDGRCENRKEELLKHL